MRAREARARQGRRSLRGMRGGHGASAVTSLTRHSPRATRDDSARGTRTRAGPQWRGARTSIMLSGPPPPPLSAPGPPPPKSMRTQVEPDPLLTSVRAGSTYPVAQPSRPSSRSPQRDIMAGDLAELAGHVEPRRFRALFSAGAAFHRLDGPRRYSQSTPIHSLPHGVRQGERAAHMWRNRSNKVYSGIRSFSGMTIGWCMDILLPQWEPMEVCQIH